MTFFEFLKMLWRDERPPAKPPENSGGGSA